LPVYWIWFAKLKGLSLHKKQQLLEHFRDPEEIYLADPKAFPAEVAQVLAEKDLSEAASIYRECVSLGIGILTYGDADYPKRMRSIEDPPMVLYFKGKLPLWQAQPVIGVVGTRKASPYGLQTAHLLGAQIAACGGLVVSGLATGIDGAAMEGALDADKPTVGVLGCGVDVVYPASNRRLYRQVQECGCLISEYPPGSRPFSWNFLQRNRIISGISDGVLVVEAPLRSGALNTARHAFSQGRDMFVVPGNLGVDSCLGSNGLLQEGAYAALSGWDVVKHYENLYPGAVENRQITLENLREKEPPKVAEEAAAPKKAQQKMETSSQISIDNREKSTYSVIDKRPVSLNDQEEAVLKLLGEAPELIDGIIDRAEMPAAAVQSVLTRLTIKGVVKQYPDGRVSRK